MSLHHHDHGRPLGPNHRVPNNADTDKLIKLSPALFQAIIDPAHPGYTPPEGDTTKYLGIGGPDYLPPWSASYDLPEDSFEWLPADKVAALQTIVDHFGSLGVGQPGPVF